MCWSRAMLHTTGYTRRAPHIVGLVQDCSTSIALAMELLQFCTKPSIWVSVISHLHGWKQYSSYCVKFVLEIEWQLCVGDMEPSSNTKYTAVPSPWIHHQQTYSLAKTHWKSSPSAVNISDDPAYLKNQLINTDEKLRIPECV